MYYNRLVKSVRLGRDLEAKLAEASRGAGKSESEVIREAVERYCADSAANRLDVMLAPFIGKVHSGLPSVSRRVDEAFTDMLIEERERKRRRTKRDSD